MNLSLCALYICAGPKLVRADALNDTEPEITQQTDVLEILDASVNGYTMSGFITLHLCLSRSGIIFTFRMTGEWTVPSHQRNYSLRRSWSGFISLKKNIPTPSLAVNHLNGTQGQGWSREELIGYYWSTRKTLGTVCYAHWEWDKVKTVNRQVVLKAVFEIPVILFTQPTDRLKVIPCVHAIDNNVSVTRREWQMYTQGTVFISPSPTMV